MTKRSYSKKDIQDFAKPLYSSMKTGAIVSEIYAKFCKKVSPQTVRNWKKESSHEKTAKKEQQINEVDEGNNVDDTGLNERQKRFCAEYCIHLNGTKAYEKVYNSKASTARTNASKLLSNTNIKEYIKHLNKNIEALTEITKVSQLLEFRKIAYSNTIDVFLNWTELKDFHGLTGEQKSSIETIEFKKLPNDETQVKIKFYNKQTALSTINKMLGYETPEKFDFSTMTDDQLSEVINELTKRANE